MLVSDPSCVFEASLWNDRMLGGKGGVEEMLAQGLVGRAVATALYSQQTLGQVGE